MKKSKNKYAKCPCCLINCHQTEILVCLDRFEKEQKETYKHYKGLQLDTFAFASFFNANFDWACDNCLQTKKAILASAEFQETPFYPHLAYFDTSHFCNWCKKEFRFKKEEKKVWYETYKLPIDAAPNQCLECRRKRQMRRDENKLLSKILKKPEPEITEHELEALIKIYTAWDKAEKVNYYQSVLKKRRKN